MLSFQSSFSFDLFRFASLLRSSYESSSLDLFLLDMIVLLMFQGLAFATAPLIFLCIVAFFSCIIFFFYSWCCFFPTPPCSFFFIIRPGAESKTIEISMVSTGNPPCLPVLALPGWPFKYRSCCFFFAVPSLSSLIQLSVVCVSRGPASKSYLVPQACLSVVMR